MNPRSPSGAATRAPGFTLIELLVTLLVGGIPALNADYQTIVMKHFVPVTALVVIGTLLALLCGFRSLFAAVKAILLNLLSVAVTGLGLPLQNFEELGFDQQTSILQKKLNVADRLCVGVVALVGKSF